MSDYNFYLRMIIESKHKHVEAEGIDGGDDVNSKYIAVEDLDNGNIIVARFYAENEKFIEVYVADAVSSLLEFKEAV